MFKRLLFTSVMLLPMAQVDARPLDYEDLKAGLAMMTYDVVCNYPGALSAEAWNLLRTTIKNNWSASEIDRANSEIEAQRDQLGRARFCRIGDLSLGPTIPEVNARSKK